MFLVQFRIYKCKAITQQRMRRHHNHAHLFQPGTAYQTTQALPRPHCWLLCLSNKYTSQKLQTAVTCEFCCLFISLDGLWLNCPYFDIMSNQSTQGSRPMGKLFYRSWPPPPTLISTHPISFLEVVNDLLDPQTLPVCSPTSSSLIRGSRYELTVKWMKMHHLRRKFKNFTSKKSAGPPKPIRLKHILANSNYNS
jgi:hypothetical protein